MITIRKRVLLACFVDCVGGRMHQPDEPLFVCRSSPFDGLDPHNFLRIVDLVKDTQIAHAETMHVLEVPLQLLDMPVHVGIQGNDINGIRYSCSCLQGVIGLPVEFDGVPMENDLMHFSDHPRRQRHLFYRLPCPDPPAGSAPSACCPP